MMETSAARTSVMIHPRASVCCHLRRFCAPVGNVITQIAKLFRRTWFEVSVGPEPAHSRRWHSHKFASAQLGVSRSVELEFGFNVDVALETPFQGRADERTSRRTTRTSAVPSFSDRPAKRKHPWVLDAEFFFGFLACLCRSSFYWRCSGIIEPSTTDEPNGPMSARAEARALVLSFVE
jgi:hypothetical protein